MSTTIISDTEVDMSDLGLGGFSVIGERHLYGTDDGRFFVASEAIVMGDQEILVFPSNEDGDIVDFLEVVGSKFTDHAEQKAALAAWLLDN